MTILSDIEDLPNDHPHKARLLQEYHDYRNLVQTQARQQLGSK